VGTWRKFRSEDRRISIHVVTTGLDGYRRGGEITRRRRP
jgi:hypothetical protein